MKCDKGYNRANVASNKLIKISEFIYYCAGKEFDNKLNLFKMKTEKIHNIDRKFLKFYATYTSKYMRIRFTEVFISLITLNLWESRKYLQQLNHFTSFTNIFLISKSRD